jgi:hypothetical protein
MNKGESSFKYFVSVLCLWLFVNVFVLERETKRRKKECDQTKLRALLQSLNYLKHGTKFMRKGNLSRFLARNKARVLIEQLVVLSINLSILSLWSSCFTP